MAEISASSEMPIRSVYEGGRAGEPILRVRGLSVGFGGPLILENLDLDVYRGEILAIVRDITTRKEAEENCFNQCEGELGNSKCDVL